MKPEYVPLSKLTPKSKSYKIKVAVKEKSPVRTPPNKRRFQKLIFADDEGNKIRETLFGDEIDHFKKLLDHQKEYIIEHAPIKPTDPKFVNREGPYQIGFGGKIAIQPVVPDSGPVLPQYTPITVVPPTSNDNNRFDILGIVVHMEDVRQKTSLNGFPFDVRDIAFVDHTVQRTCYFIYQDDQALIIFVYGELAIVDCEQFSNWLDSFKIVRFRHLKPAIHRGFSLASSMSTTIDPNPTSLEAVALRDWNNFTFIATNGTGSIRFTAFGEEYAKLLHSTPTELLEKKKQETWPEFSTLAVELQYKASLIQVDLAGTIKRSGMLKRYVKVVSLD
ncbi:replication factor A protein 1-like [Chenopodium quinoa]|uniref:Uncharacterized protein n=1 Tax=Chenopodium quinoa TaxID=63459 RepID=A0A803MLE7_CHEQI|nr:replication factor A protein 1-like [Chenopodium quinoa]